MRTADKVLLTMGSAMLITSGLVMAAEPIPYNGWSVTGGTVSAGSCPSGFTCGTPITGNGFYQRQVTDNVSGNKYFQTIITPTDATATTLPALQNLEFTDENFVLQGGGTGIADSQHVFAAGSTSNPGDFSSTTAINSGWAKTNAATNAIDVTQTVVDNPSSLTNPPFALSFNLQDASTDNSAPVITIREDVSLYAPANPNSDVGDKQTFYLVQGKATAGAGTSITLPAGATPTDSINWSANDIVQAMWMGQKVTAGTGGTQDFGVISYSDVTPANAATTSYADQGAIGSAGTSATGPGSWWDTTPANAYIFGDEPLFLYTP